MLLDIVEASSTERTRVTEAHKLERQTQTSALPVLLHLAVDVVFEQRTGERSDVSSAWQERCRSRQRTHSLAYVVGRTLWCGHRSPGAGHIDRHKHGTCESQHTRMFSRPSEDGQVHSHRWLWWRCGSGSRRFPCRALRRIASILTRSDAQALSRHTQKRERERARTRLLMSLVLVASQVYRAAKLLFRAPQRRPFR